MTDLFALLGEPRRPSLDPERVKETFHRLSRTAHPDHASSSTDDSDAAFAQLNFAQATLRDPKARLRHLLELEYPQIRLSGPSEVAPSFADLLVPFHVLLHDIDALLARKAAAPSTLARALLICEELARREHAEQILAELSGLEAAAHADLRSLDAAWEPRPPDAAARLQDLYQRFSYLSRWTDQLRERLFQLGT